MLNNNKSVGASFSAGSGGGTLTTPANGGSSTSPVNFGWNFGSGSRNDGKGLAVQHKGLSAGEYEYTLTICTDEAMTEGCVSYSSGAVTAALPWAAGGMILVGALALGGGRRRTVMLAAGLLLTAGLAATTGCGGSSNNSSTGNSGDSSGGSEGSGVTVTSTGSSGVTLAPGTYWWNVTRTDANGGSVTTATWSVTVTE